MSRPARSLAVAVASAAAAMVAGCGSSAPAAPGPAAEAPPGGAPFLATSLVTPAGTWAVAVMGGSVASDNNFWQLFERPAGTADWKLVTPRGTADNGGLVLAAGAGPSLITGFRPSQYLTYTPLTSTVDGGQAWSSTGPLDGTLANVPDALAASPGAGHLLALLADGTTELATRGYTSWSALASRRSLAATQAGRACGMGAVTAVTYTHSAVPLIAGACSRPGTTGIFADTNGVWQAAGPQVPVTLARQPITVLRLTQTANQTVALLMAGPSHHASLLAAWSNDNGRHWALSSALPLGTAQLESASFGLPGTAAVMTTSGRAYVVSGGKQWLVLPAPPAGTATIAFNSDRQADALAVHRGTLTIWQLPFGGAAWTKTQTINVPIQYGSSS